MKDHVVESKPDREAFETKVMDAYRRAKTTKCECLMIKKLGNNALKLADRQDSVRKYIAEHAHATQQEATKWVFAVVWAEAQKLLAAKA